MPTDPRDTVRAAAAALLRELAALPDLPPLRCTEADGRVACLIQVWDVSGVMPTAAAEGRAKGRRAGCRTAIVAAVRAAGRPLTRKQLMRALRDAGQRHGVGTVAKALAELTKAGELVNPRDRRGYRLPEWPRRRPTPSLFG